MAEKKNNMATRVVDEIIAGITEEISKIRKEAYVLEKKAEILREQSVVLCKQSDLIKAILESGNYEKNGAAGE